LGEQGVRHRLRRSAGSKAEATARPCALRLARLGGIFRSVELARVDFSEALPGTAVPRGRFLFWAHLRQPRARHH
jgi:hypothetical protein